MMTSRGHVNEFPYDECGPFTDDPEERKKLAAIFDEVKSLTTMQGPKVGIPLIMGTGGKLTDENPFKKIWISEQNSAAG